MRVAVALVGQVYPGQEENVKLSLDNIKCNLITPNSADVFLVAEYNSVLDNFETTNTYFCDPTDPEVHQPMRGFAQYAKVAKCYELIKNAKTYDIIVRLRLDAIVNRTIVFDSGVKTNKIIMCAGKQDGLYTCTANFCICGHKVFEMYSEFYKYYTKLEPMPNHGVLLGGLGGQEVEAQMIMYLGYRNIEIVPIWLDFPDFELRSYGRTNRIWSIKEVGKLGNNIKRFWDTNENINVHNYVRLK